ncbi:MAG: efflux RND transporter periplasmic adaptor subunit [Flavobacteriaceae bacterium]|nr:efflux RND transporter periplasmic adaptor subunit [Flavobacteriaceae bacterium]
MSKKTIYIILGAVILLIVILIGGKKAGLFGKSGDFKEVEVEKIARRTIQQTVSATGKIQPTVEVKISAEVSGEIIELTIQEGQQVKKGELLVKINPDLFQSALARTQASLLNVKSNLAQAEANLKEAEANYQRNEGLFKKGVISASEWDRIVAARDAAMATKESARYNVLSSAATVKEAQDNLIRTNIYAPMDGTISKLDVELGERVVGTQQFEGTEILRVANLSKMEVLAEVNENDIVKISLGDTAIVEVDAYLKREFIGIVSNIANTAINTTSVDQITNFEVKVNILPESYADLTVGKPENFSPFRPGMTATVDIITEKKTNVLTVPISAVVVRTDTSSTKKTATPTLANTANKAVGEERFECVFVKIGETAKLKVVKTGIQDNTYIEIASGLDDESDVITGPYNVVTKLLSPNDKVAIKQVEKSKE